MVSSKWYVDSVPPQSPLFSLTVNLRWPACSVPVMVDWQKFLFYATLKSIGALLGSRLGNPVLLGPLMHSPHAFLSVRVAVAPSTPILLL